MLTSKQLPYRRHPDVIQQVRPDPVPVDECGIPTQWAASKGLAPLWTLLVVTLACALHLGQSLAFLGPRKLLTRAGNRGFTGTLGTYRSISTTPTNPAAMAYSNEKKVAVLASGREVMVIGDTTTNAEFWHSIDDWATKTHYTAGTSDLPGASNVAIAPLVIAGTDCLVAVWEQSGTGGGRTNGFVYMAVGIFNAGATTLTWGTAITVSGDAAYGPYLDVVAHAEGSGGKAHVVFGYNGGNAVYHTIATINSSGVLTGWGGNSQFGTGVGADSRPSITFDPATKDLFVVWYDLATGVGKGVQFIRIAYTGGTWPPGATVPVDTTVYPPDIAYYVKAEWWAAGGILYISGLVWDGTIAKRMLYETSNFTSFTQDFLVSTTNTTDTLTVGSSAVDPNTGDVYFLGRLYNSGCTDLIYRRWTRATATIGAVVTIETSTALTLYGPSTNYGGHATAWARTTKIGFAWTSGTVSPWTIKAVALT